MKKDNDLINKFIETPFIQVFSERATCSIKTKNKTKRKEEIWKN